MKACGLQLQLQLLRVRYSTTTAGQRRLAHWQRPFASDHRSRCHSGPAMHAASRGCSTGRGPLQSAAAPPPPSQSTVHEPYMSRSSVSCSLAEEAGNGVHASAAPSDMTPTEEPMTAAATTVHTRQRHRGRSRRRRKPRTRDEGPTASQNSAKGSPALHRLARHIATTRTLSARERQCCQWIAGGAWATALEAMAAYRKQTPPLHASQPYAAPAQTASLQHNRAATSSAVSLEETCVWSLLWMGHRAAAWRVWQEMSADRPPRLLLLFALSLQFAARDRRCMQEVLLLLEMAMGADEENASVSMPEELISLFLLWLRCCTEGATSPEAKSGIGSADGRLAELFHAAVHCITACLATARVDPENVPNTATAKTAAMLLLSAHALCGDRLAGVAAASSAPHDSPLACFEAADACALVGSEVRAFMARATQLECGSCGVLSGAEVAENDQSSDVLLNTAIPFQTAKPPPALTLEPQESAALHNRTRAVLQEAEQQLALLKRAENRTARQHGSDRLTLYRFWSEAALQGLGCADEWAARRAALAREGGLAMAVGASALPEQTDSATQARHHSSREAAAAAALLRRIRTASDRGEWVAALRLCLHGSRDDNEPATSNPISDDYAVECVGEPSLVPWLQRLRMGLVACETAAATKRFSHTRSSPWQGALALWRFARMHHRKRELSIATETSSLASAAPPLLQREYGRILMLLASATRWAEALACFHDCPVSCVDGFVVSQVAYALRASADRHDLAVLGLWAEWRCRVGDTAAPTEEMVAQLLQAMLHVSSSAPAATVTCEGPAVAFSSCPVTGTAAPTQAVAEVATRLLVAAAVTESTTPSEERQTTSLAGTPVPLNWRRHQHTVLRLLQDRWVGSWAEALSVACASGDSEALRSAALRVPSSHPPSLFADTVRLFRERGVTLGPADRAALLAMWGASAADVNEHGGPEAPPLLNAHRRTLRATHFSQEPSRGAVQRATKSTEALLDELLGKD